MTRTATQYDIYENVGSFAIRREEGFISLAGAKASLLALNAQTPGDYWIRKIETNDYSASDLGIEAE